MKKVILLCLVIALAALPMLGCKQEAKVVNIFTWADYFPRDVLDAFTEKTGIKVEFSSFSSNEEMLAKLEAVKGGTYDIVLASDYIIDIARGEGLLAELDKSKIPNFKNINSAYQGQFFDPDNKYTVPYAAGTPLIVYDPAKVPFEITGYEDLWNPALADSVVVMDDMRNIMGITLKTLGYSFNTTDLDKLAEAREKIMLLKPQIRAFDYDTPQNKVISGECSVGYMFTPQVVQVKFERPEIEIVYPKEGMGWGIDSIFVPKDAPNKNSAFAFLDFILDPQIGASISESELYICCNEAAIPFLSEDYLSNQALYIPKDVLGEAEYIMDVGEATSIYEQIWAEFK